MKEIIIEYDFSSDFVKSYIEVLNSIKEGRRNIHTNCLEFFSFSTLGKGYEVVVVKDKGEYIRLSELFENDGKNDYTNRIIKKGHDVKKLLLAGEFQFKRIWNVE